LPALVFFKKGEEEEPIIYAGIIPIGLKIFKNIIFYNDFLRLGDLKKSEKILDWLINQKDPSLDKIEDVDASTLRKLIETSDHLAVYFCKSTIFMHTYALKVNRI